MNELFYGMLFLLGLVAAILILAWWIVSNRNNSHHHPYTDEWYDIDDDHYNHFN